MSFPHGIPDYSRLLCQEVHLGAYVMSKVFLYRFREWQEMGDFFLISRVALCLQACL